MKVLLSQGATPCHKAAGGTTLLQIPLLFARFFFWQYSNDNNQFLNAFEVIKAVASCRCQWYRAIEAEESGVDTMTRKIQEKLRSQSVIDNWPRRDIAFVTDNIPRWSRYMIRHDNSAESIVSLPLKLPVSAAYARHPRQALARPRG